MYILLIDDEEDLVSTLAERLVLRGLSVDWVTSGDEALKLVELNRYDAVVIDMKMPKMNGLELKGKLETIRPGMQYLFMSGHGSASGFRDGSEAVGGTQFFLLKPVDIDVVIDRLQTLVDLNTG